MAKDKVVSVTTTQLAKELRAHDAWERKREDRNDVRHEQEEERIATLERAIIQFNHFSEALEVWQKDMIKFQGDVGGQLKWITIFVSATAVAAISQIVLGLLK